MVTYHVKIGQEHDTLLILSYKLKKNAVRYQVEIGAIQLFLL